MKRLAAVVLLLLILSVCASSANAGAVTINFNEFEGHFGLLDTQTLFPDLTFENAFRFGADPRLHDDGYGVYNRLFREASITFAEPTPYVEFAWAILHLSNDFYAKAYDSAGALVESFHATLAPNENTAFGYARLSGTSPISRFEFHDGGMMVAIDTLTYMKPPISNPVPAAAWIGLSVLGAMGLYRRFRRRA